MIKDIQNRFDKKSTDELLSIWNENNREQYSDQAFQAVENLLKQRNVDIIPQLPKNNDNNKKIPDVKKIKRQIRNAWLACLFITILPLIFNFNITLLVFSAPLFALAFGIFMKSRLCAVLNLVYFTYLYWFRIIHIPKPRTDSFGVILFVSIVGVFFLVFFRFYINGVIGTFAYHKLNLANKATAADAKSRAAE